MDDKQKNCIMIAIIAGCLSIMIFMGLFGWLGVGVFLRIPLVIIISGGVGAGAYYRGPNAELRGLFLSQRSLTPSALESFRKSGGSVELFDLFRAMEPRRS